MSESAVADAADAQEIAVLPIARSSLQPTGANGLVLGFGSVKLAEIRAGVEGLAQVLESLVQTGRR